jgi:hypothetical protein
MRFLLKLGAVLAALLVLGVATASMASAADPLWLFSKTGFKVAGGAGTLSTLGNFFSITCKKLEGTGNTGGNDTETFTGTLTFKECNANSLGSASGVISYAVNGLLCWTNEAKLEVGLYIAATNAVHLENVPLIGLLSFSAGSSDVASITPVNTATTTLTEKLTQSGGDQSITSCVDLGTTLKPKISVTQNEGTEVKDGAIGTEAKVTTEVSGTVDG